MIVRVMEYYEDSERIKFGGFCARFVYYDDISSYEEHTKVVEYLPILLTLWE